MRGHFGSVSVDWSRALSGQCAPTINPRNSASGYAGGWAHCGGSRKRLQWEDALNDRRLQHDIAEVFLDPDVALKQVFHPRLVVVDVAANEAQQPVVTAADKMTFHQFVDVAHIGLELYEIFLAVIDQGDFGEDRYALCQLG